MGSPLRLRLVAELLDAPEGLTLQRAVFLTGRYVQDVETVLRPMVAWGLVIRVEGEELYRIDRSAPTEHVEAMAEVVERRHDVVERERRVRQGALCGMIGLHPKMAVVFENVMQLARLDVPVLVTGETGTGKELVARAIHELSARRDALFGAINCGTLSDEMFATEMLGHVKGAFTGAIRAHSGLVERCHEGTLFLDEVADLNLVNQVKLLRTLQEGTFRRVGDERQRRSDFRVISATNQELEQMVVEGRFREDLYYRLNVFPLRLPSLRERVEDLPYIADDLLHGPLNKYVRYAGESPLTEAATERLQSHSWPGNVRELENVLMRAAIVAGNGPIDESHLPDLAGAATNEAPSSGGAGVRERLSRTLAEVERDYITAVLHAQGQNVSATARNLGISRTTLYNKIKSYEIEVQNDGEDGTR